MPLRIVLAAVDDALAQAWEQFCGDLNGVTIHRGSLLDLALDAVVSPANSFGFMDGGIDRLYSAHFGWGVQERLQALIRDRHRGELLVGAAEIVETGDLRIPFLIAAPTMRVPMILRETVHPYLAARAALLSIRFGTIPSGPFAGEPVSSAVQSVGFPGLGTGIGRVPPETCARQVRLAIEAALFDRLPFPATWAEAQTAHQLLYADEARDLQRD